jgi:hypothetical protein
VGFEFRSEKTIPGLGIPWVHVAWGVDPFTGRYRVARGVVAVGPFALGAIAVGPFAVGLLAVGQVAVGLGGAAGQIAAAALALGQIAFGAAGALGQLALGPAAAAFAWVAAGTVLGWSAVHSGRGVARLCARGATIAAAPPGAAVVRGRVLPLATLEAPVSRRPCVAYDVRRVRDRSVRAERTCQDFVVDDGTGLAHVVAEEAVLLLEPVRRVHEAALRRVAARADAAGKGAVTAGVGPPVGTAVERVLLAGEEVVVAGLALRTITPDGSRLAVQGGGLGPVLVTNRDPRELRGEVNLALWLAVPLALAALLAAALMALS